MFIAALFMIARNLKTVNYQQEYRYTSYIIPYSYNGGLYSSENTPIEEH